MSARRIAVLVAVWTLPSVIFLAITWSVYAKYRITVPDRLGPDARAAAMATLRTAMDGGGAKRPDHPELERALPNQGPVIVTVWYAGRPVARINAFGDTIADALLVAARTIPKEPKLGNLTGQARTDARVKVDVVVGRGVLPKRGGLLTAIALNPGLEGFGVVLGADKTRPEKHIFLLPGDLVRYRMLSKSRPLEFVKEFAVGLDFDRADAQMARLAQLPAGGYGASERSYFRFRTDAFIEQPVSARGKAPPFRVTRNVIPRPELTKENLREAAISGGRYLVAHICPSDSIGDDRGELCENADVGRYVYEHDLSTGQGTPARSGGPYSLPRHAGTTYFLAELYRITGEAFLREPIERAFAHLSYLVRAGGCRGKLPNGKPFACVVDKGVKTASLGSTALGVVALAEYKRATGDKRYDKLTNALAEWILFMQLDNGGFAHLYDIPNKARDEKTQLLYFSGEAALAMARMYVITKDERYIRSAERALDHLVGWYDFFAGGFFYGEEHWTCIASEAAWPHLKHDRYREFCSGYARFLRMQQPLAGEFPDQTDLAGSYGFSPFVLPHNTPAGSRTEAMISSYLLTKYHGKPDAAILTQIKRAMSFALGQQVRPGNDWNVVPKAVGMGAIPGSPIDRTVRIDYVQHVCSAMIRTAELME